jgi:hypothetical protein
MKMDYIGWWDMIRMMEMKWITAKCCADGGFTTNPA